MTRTRKFDRDEAIKWVMNKMWLGGFENLSVKFISESLGITRSSFYHSFTSREALFIEALNQYYKESPHIKLTQFTQSKSPLRLLTQTFKKTCEIRSNDSKHRGCFAVNSVSELVGVNKQLGPIIEKAVLESIKCFENLLNDSIKKNELSTNTNTHELALALQNILMGLNTMSKVVKSKNDLWSATKLNLQALKVYA